jgi:predicted permease
MKSVRAWLVRFASLFNKGERDRELAAEMDSHLQIHIDENVRRGMTPAEARREALMKLGGIEQTKENYRERRGLPVPETLAQDIRYALRILRKSPGFAAVAILTLALGIGANTAIFSMVDWLTLRVPSVAKPEQVATLASQETDGSYGNGFSYPNFADIRNQSATVFSDVAAIMDFQADGLSVDGKSEPMWAGYVTGNFFSMMGVKPALGNLIEATPGTPPDDEPVLVLGYAYWKSHFGGDPRVIGKSALVNGRPVTIIGVAPKGFHGVSPLLDTQGYLPLGMAAVTADADKDFVTNRKNIGMTISARLKPGVTLASAQPALKVIARRLAAQYPSDDKWRALVAYGLGPLSPISDPGTPNTVRLMDALFLTLAGLVLILACLNVANLLLARASGRQREMAVRAALGGLRTRLIRQLLTESLLLALLGCAAGIALGLAASRWLGSINLHVGFPFVLDFQFDWRVFSYAVGAAVATALLVGIAPALCATRGNLNDLLHESARTATAGRQRTRSVLVVAQVGGSLMLLIVAGLFVRSLRHVQRANLGFDPNGVLNFTINAHQTGYNEAQAQNFLRNLLPRVRALPGVETASLAATVPMGPTYLGMGLRIDGYQPPAGQSAPFAGCDAVSPQYFATMRIPVLRGRTFLDSDSQTSPHVAVINQTMAEKYWHGQDPLGRHFINTDDPKQSIEVVGIVKNIRIGQPYGPYEPYVYVPLVQRYDYQLPVTLQLRTSLPLATMNREVVGTIHSLAPTMPVLDIQTMTESLSGLNGFMLFQFAAGLAASLGILGLTLATVGVYGVVSYGASQRTHEIGIRMALGAQPAQVLKMIFRQALFITGAGIALGVLAAACIARLVGNFIVGVSSLDAVTYVSAVLIIAAVALLACYIPARRAMKVDPMVALRYE